MMQEQNGPIFGLVGVVLLVTLGSLMFSDVAPTSTRPSDAEQVRLVTDESVAPARLWQDPIRAVLNNKPPNGSQSPASFDTSLKPLVDGVSNITVLGIMTNTTPYAAFSERRRSYRYALVTALRRASYIPRQTQLIGVNQFKSLAATVPGQSIPPRSFDVPFEWFDALPTTSCSTTTCDSCAPKVLVLWLDEKQFAQRPLTRIATLAERLNLGADSALKIIGPSDSALLGQLSEEAQSSTGIAFPSEPPQQTVVEIFSPFSTMPVAALNRSVLSQEIPSEGKLTELNIPKECVKDQLEGRELLLCQHLLAELQLKKNIERAQVQGVHFKFHRTINHDFILADRLVTELAAHRIKYEPEPVGNDDREAKHNDDSQPKCDGEGPVCLHSDSSVVLISELDSEYGRALPQAFRDAFCQGQDSCKQVLEFSYLRGVDGIASGAQPAMSLSGGDNDDQQDSLMALEGINKQRAVGPAQYDYIDRLGMEMSYRDTQLKQHNGKGIAAIGLLGNDVYDQLIILKTLKKRFPKALFFTTDAHAEWFHAADYMWTRNLIIASSFGLKLNPGIQKQVPPFRSSYQSAVYIATLLAVDRATVTKALFRKDVTSPQPIDHILSHIEPVMIEVGRNGPVRLLNRFDSQHSTPSRSGIAIANNANDIHQVNYLPMKNIGTIGFSVLLLFAAGLVIGGYRLNYGQRPINRIGIKSFNSKDAAVFFALATYMALTVVMLGPWFAQPEPALVFDGISAWPAAYIRAAIPFCCFIFLGRSLIELNKNSQRIQSTFGLPSYRRRTRRSGLYKKLWQLAGHSSFGKRLIRNFVGWQCDKVIALIVFCMVPMAAYKMLGASQVFYFWWLLIIVGLLVAWSVMAAKVWRIKRLARWENELVSAKQNERIRLATLWRQYGYYSSSYPRVARVCTNTFIYMVFFSCLWLIFTEGFPTHIRGPMLFVIGLVFIISVLSMLYTIFFVVDVTRQCSIWIRALSRPDLTMTPANLHYWQERLQVPPKLAEYATRIDLIAWRSKHVSHMVYFPFLAILLTILSTTNYFDNWQFPLPLALMLAINVAICTMNAFQLNGAAIKARAKILSKLRVAAIKAQQAGEGGTDSLRCSTSSFQRSVSQLGLVSYGKPVTGVGTDQYLGSQQQIEMVIELIERRTDGAFRKFYQQPIVKAFVFLVGGLGFAISQYSAISS
ncbi:hypothetical protein K0504_11165 [Neiella marina]|uniref:Uncharacterized protein n=1 Tax=Neiella holothuriorum TaxID=2870530 RepID=A0ABS7EGY1_9GAMM|nr:hypothetical protein [Neiella holothuriorum]MBW8191598.1 hypothetical protein [Neiella holothuriorum]